MTDRRPPAPGSDPTTKPPGWATPYAIAALSLLSLLVLFVAFFVRALAGSDLTDSTGSEGEVQLILAFANFAWIGLAGLGFGRERRRLVSFGLSAFGINFFCWLVVALAVFS